MDIEATDSLITKFLTFLFALYILKCLIWLKAFGTAKDEKGYQSLCAFCVKLCDLCVFPSQRISGSHPASLLNIAHTLFDFGQLFKHMAKL